VLDITSVKTRDVPWKIPLFCKNVLVPLAKTQAEGLSYGKIASKFAEVFDGCVKKETIRKDFIEPLKATGLVVVEPHPQIRGST
jgi:hypothetical protein